MSTGTKLNPLIVGKTTLLDGAVGVDVDTRVTNAEDPDVVRGCGCCRDRAPGPFDSLLMLSNPNPKLVK